MGRISLLLKVACRRNIQEDLLSICNLSKKSSNKKKYNTPGGDFANT